MMDKKDPKKKRKPLNNKQNSMASDKENMNTANEFGISETLFAVLMKPPRKETDYDGVLQLRNYNFCTPDNTNNRKRSISSVNEDHFISDVANESYWQNLALNDRDALASALNENRDLHNRITELEDENVRLKALLDEARSLVEVLTELLEEEGEDSLDDKSDDSIWDDL